MFSLGMNCSAQRCAKRLRARTTQSTPAPAAAPFAAAQSGRAAAPLGPASDSHTGARPAAAAVPEQHAPCDGAGADWVPRWRREGGDGACAA